VKRNKVFLIVAAVAFGVFVLVALRAPSEVAIPQPLLKSESKEIILELNESISHVENPELYLKNINDAEKALDVYLKNISDEGFISSVEEVIETHKDAHKLWQLADFKGYPHGFLIENEAERNRFNEKYKLDSLSNSKLVSWDGALAKIWEVARNTAGNFAENIQ